MSGLFLFRRVADDTACELENWHLVSAIWLTNAEIKAQMSIVTYWNSINAVIDWLVIIGGRN